jgi:hypothetical protein
MADGTPPEEKVWRMATTSVTVVRETERKYDAPDTVELPDPAAALGLSGGVEEQVLTAVYFDTPDLRLLRAGITLRRREGGCDEGWHLKLPAGGDSRDELRLPLSSGGRRPPSRLVTLVRARTRGAALGPVAELTTHRRRWRLSDGEGATSPNWSRIASSRARWATGPGPSPGGKSRPSTPTTVTPTCWIASRAGCCNSVRDARTRGPSFAQLQTATKLSRSSMYATYGNKRGLFERAALSYLKEIIDTVLGPMEADQARRRSRDSSWRWRRYCGPRTTGSPSVAAS